MIYTATCLNCGNIIYTTRDMNSCGKCGQIMLTETNPERDRRLGISRLDIDSWNNPDPLLAHLKQGKETVKCG